MIYKQKFWWSWPSTQIQKYSIWHNAVRETRITKQTSLTTNINAQNHGIEFTPPESSAGGTLLDIASHLSYKLRPDINIYKANQLDSTFVEINPQKSNIVIGCLCK